MVPQRKKRILLTTKWCTVKATTDTAMKYTGVHRRPSFGAITQKTNYTYNKMAYCQSNDWHCNEIHGRSSMPFHFSKRYHSYYGVDTSASQNATTPITVWTGFMRECASGQNNKQNLERGFVAAIIDTTSTFGKRWCRNTSSCCKSDGVQSYANQLSDWYMCTNSL